jgi:hypothetical protein
MPTLTPTPTPTSTPTQAQLLASIEALQTEQRTNMNNYAAALTLNERTRIMNRMKDNETLRTNLLQSLGAVTGTNAQQAANQATAAKDLTFALLVAEHELKTQGEQLDAVQQSHDGKKRMIELNTYYGKRFMAQADVMKIFIYLCIPVLIIAYLANAGLFPNYIAGFMIIAIVVIGVVYIYAAVHDINRRDKMNFDEYTWEFDPSRVGTIVNPNYGATGSDANGNMVGCFNGKCCGPNTQWDATSGRCGASTSTSTTRTSTTRTSTTQPAAAASGFVGNLTTQSKTIKQLLADKCPVNVGETRDGIVYIHPTNTATRYDYLFSGCIDAKTCETDITNADSVSDNILKNIPNNGDCGYWNLGDYFWNNTSKKWVKGKTVRERLTEKCPLSGSETRNGIVYINPTNSATRENYLFSGCTDAGTCDNIPNDYSKATKNQIDPISKNLLNNISNNCGSWTIGDYSMNGTKWIKNK